MTAPSDEAVVARTAAWVERVVIGLNLCPFARTVQLRGQIRYVVSAAETVPVLRGDLTQQLLTLRDTPAEQLETTLLIHPRVLQDFLDYNDFLGEADELLEELGLAGEIQLASFHPQYRFADSAGDGDPANYTNRSPYPTLHLLREASISRAVDAFGDTSTIYERNIRTLRALPPAELQSLSSEDD